MKRLATLAVAVLASVQLVGCGPSETQAAAAEATVERASPAASQARVTAKSASVGWHTEPITDPTQQDLLREVRTLRSRIEVYEEHKGRAPDLVARSWRDLLAGGYVDAPPANPLSPAPVATRILVTDIPGATGADVNPDAVGWVWNRADTQLFAAGLPDADLP